MAIELIILLLSIGLLLYFYGKHKHNYFKRHNVPYLKPEFLFGNLREILFFHRNVADVITSIYREAVERDVPVMGMYNSYSPGLVIKDLNLLKRILIKDFNQFSNRYLCVSRKSDQLSFYNIFFLKNPDWRDVRTNITPVFTSGKMKQMFSLIGEIGKELDSHIKRLKPDPKTNKIIVDMKALSALYTTDVIATVAYGISANSLKNPNGEFRSNGRTIFDFTLKKAIDFNLIFFQPNLAKLFGSWIFSTETTKFIKSAVHQAIDLREKTGTVRNDLIDIFVSLKKSPIRDDQKLNMDLLVAQAAVFFSAGFETTSSTMSFSMFEMAKDQNCQKRLREEIRDMLENNNGELTYDGINNMEYLHMVVSEILRLYPSLPLLDRECTAPEGYSLKPELDYTVPYGMPIFISNYGFHRDPQYFPDPEKFDPERFSPENRDQIVPYSYLPFGLGPHNCIGERLGLLQVKIGLISILRNHYVTLAEKTPTNMKLHPMAFLIQAEKGVHCEIVHDPLFK